MKYFTINDFVDSSTARKHGINNSPTEEAKHNIENLVNYCLDPLREKMGIPLQVSSGYRSPALNKAVGGSSTSQHCFGQAADIQTTGNKENLRLFQVAQTMDYDQILWEFGTASQPQWVHISYVSPEKNRHQVLKAVKENGKTKYIRIK